jgi:hypothetical protein
MAKLKDVFERNKYDLMTSVRRSRAWFEQQVLIMSRQDITPQRVLQGNTEQLTTRVMPGFMYMFAYDPKGKADLPYYDRFPLVLPFNKTADGFIGLNLHYLPYPLRITLLDQLLVFKNNSKLDETTRIKYSWGLISGVSKYAAAKPCVKQYLNGHVRSQFRQINANDWATAVLLPVERFVGASKQEIWADSRKVMTR